MRNPASGSRALGIDAARGVAVLSMFVAHVAPSDGPGKALLLSEFLTAPLFAMLVGVGAQLGHGRPGELPSGLVRGAVLVAVGLALAQVPMQIVIVLLWLGLLSWICLGLVRLPSMALTGIAIGLVALGPWLADRVSFWLAVEGFGPDSVVLRAADVLITSPYYRLLYFVAYACVGIVAARHLRTRGALRWAAVLALIAAAALFALDKAKVASLDPYAGTHQETAFNASFALAVLLGTQLLVGSLRRIGPPLAALGSMALTLYVLQVLGTAAYLQTDPATGRDDSWVVLAALVLGSLALAVAWPRIVRTGPFHRGPLEGVAAVLVTTAGGRPGSRSGQTLRNRT